MVNSSLSSNLYARVETERRVLLKRLPDDLSDNAPYVRIVDRYIHGTRLRLRRFESPDGEVVKWKLGQKFREAGQPPEETMMTTMYLNEAEYDRLSVLEGNQIVKRRYRHCHEDRDFTLDIFEGHLAGLILMEIEWSPDSQDLSIPDLPYIERDVTDDPFFSGGNLATLSVEDFQKWLERDRLNHR